MNSIYHHQTNRWKRTFSRKGLIGTSFNSTQMPDHIRHFHSIKFALFSRSFETDSNIWSRDVQIPVHKDVPYRYLICTVDPITENVHVRRWETHVNPRQISADHDEVTQINSESSPVAEAVPQQPSSPSKTSAPEIDTFGDINGVEKIDRGWLTTETVFQFKFIRNPFILKQKLKNRLLYVKVSIVCLLNFKPTDSISKKNRRITCIKSVKFRLFCDYIITDSIFRVVLWYIFRSFNSILFTRFCTLFWIGLFS